MKAMAMAMACAERRDLVELLRGIWRARACGWSPTIA
jgi:hypothetical protein